MPRWAAKSLTGWGRVLQATSSAARPERIAELEAIFRDTGSSSLIAFGAGRSYGDAALNSSGRTVMMSRLNRFLDFDPSSGKLVAEAGVTFSDVISTFLPRGFMMPVAPGTGFATLGGGVANDVHGKNHHRSGSFGQHVEWFDLRMPTGETRRVEPERDATLFRATFGGVGLTGVIERVCFCLKPVPSNAMLVKKRRIQDLDHYFQAFAEEHDRADYIVGWIDALAKGRHMGRGVLECATHSPAGLAPTAKVFKRIPFDLPGVTLNSVCVRAFNYFYYRHVPANGVESLIPVETFMFPLDSIREWNRIYGRRGFHQFQCVIPFEYGDIGMRRILDAISKSGTGSSLAVLKAMGPRGAGYLSFAQPGYSLALDFPNRPGIASLIAQLNRIACDHGGRIYLAKDSTLSPDMFRVMYPELPKFQAVLADIDPGGRMNSDLAQRLGLKKELP